MWEDSDYEKYIQDLIDSSIFFVQASHFEQHCLWVENVERFKRIKSFEHHTPYYNLKIGRYKGEDICVSLGLELIDG